MSRITYSKPNFKVLNVEKTPPYSPETTGTVIEALSCFMKDWTSKEDGNLNGFEYGEYRFELTHVPERLIVDIIRLD